MALALAVNHVWAGLGPSPAAAVGWALTLLFVMACWVLFRSADFATAGDVLVSMVGRTASGTLSLDREYVAALVGGAAIALLGPTSQEAALARLQPNPWLAVPAGVAAGLSAAAGRRPAAECLHLLPVLTPLRLGAASSAPRSARPRCWPSVIYAFVVLVDPFDTLPLSPPADRAPVATNARFSFPALARSRQFDSAIFGTSTSRLLRPAVLDAAFGARFANLAMNDATVHEQSRMLTVFARAHPAARVVVVGLDVRCCVTGDDYEKLTPRPFPEWMYDSNPWRGYGEMFNLYAVQEAGQQFGILTGIKRRRYGRDGYTSFVPPDSEYDPARVALHLRDAGAGDSTRRAQRRARRPGAIRRWTSLDPTCRCFRTGHAEDPVLRAVQSRAHAAAGYAGRACLERVQAARCPACGASPEHACRRFHAGRARSPRRMTTTGMRCTTASELPTAWRVTWRPPTAAGIGRSGRMSSEGYQIARR